MAFLRYFETDQTVTDAEIRRSRPIDLLTLLGS